MVKVDIPKEIQSELKCFKEIILPIKPQLEEIRLRLRASLMKYHSDMTSKEWKAVMDHVTVQIFNSLGFYEDGIESIETTKPK